MINYAKNRVDCAVILCGLIALVILFCPVETSAVEARRPNVVYILADDLGWGDLGINKGSIPTPGIDRLFNQAARRRFGRMARTLARENSPTRTCSRMSTCELCVSCPCQWARAGKHTVVIAIASPLPLSRSGSG